MKFSKEPAPILGNWTNVYLFVTGFLLLCIYLIHLFSQYYQ